MQSKPAVKGPWMDQNLSPDQRAGRVIKQMTVDEKSTIPVRRSPNQQEWRLSSLFSMGRKAATCPICLSAKPSHSPGN